MKEAGAVGGGRIHRLRRAPFASLRAVALSVALLSAAGSASAQDFSSFGGPPPKESPRGFKLFDSKRTIHSGEVDVGPFWARPVGRGEGFRRGTGEIRAGVVYTTPFRPFYLAGSQQMTLRAFDSKSFAFSPFTTQMIGGLLLGPFEPEVRVGISLLTVDVFHGEYSAELLSPRVSVALGLHLGKIRLDFQAHSEYLWRWFGPDYLIRGVAIGFRLDLPSPKSPLETSPKDSPVSSF